MKIQFKPKESVEIRLGGQGKKPLVVTRFGAYGDMLLIQPIINELAKTFEIHLITNKKGCDVFLEDPRIKVFHLFEPFAYPEEVIVEKTKEFVTKTLKKYPGAKYLDCTGTIEGAMLFIPGTREFYLPIEERRKLVKGRNYFEPLLKRLEEIGITLEALCLKSYNITNYEDFELNTWKAVHRDDFKVFIAVAGSCLHKYYDKMVEVVEQIHNKYPEARIHLVGGTKEADIAWVQELSKKDRIINVCGNYNLRQVWALSLAADLVIGPETALMLLAGSFGVPKVTLLSHSSPEQFANLHQNDMPLQANCDCSPCHLLVKKIEECENIVAGVPACVSAFKVKDIMHRVESAYLHFKENLEKTSKFYNKSADIIQKNVTEKLENLIESAPK